MESIVLLTTCFLALLVSCNAQFNLNLPFDSNEYTLGKLLDPLLAQALKLKYPKKYSSKLGFQRDVSNKMMRSRHLKNLNAVNQDLQKMYQQLQQTIVMPSVAVTNQASLSPHQQCLSNIQNHYDTRRRFTFSPSTDGQTSALLQVTDQHFSLPYQLTGIESVSSLRPQQALY